MPETPSVGARYFSKIFGNQHASPTFTYIQETGLVWQDENGSAYTGAFRPLRNTDLASIANISVSGLNVSVGSVAVTGGNISLNNTTPIAISGVVQAVIGGSASSVLAISGVVSQPHSIVAPNADLSGVADQIITGMVLDLNPNRVYWQIQNVGTGKLFVRLGGPASDKKFNIIIGSASASLESDGGSYIDSDGIWRGSVYVSGSAGAQFSVWEL